MLMMYKSFRLGDGNGQKNSILEIFLVTNKLNDEATFIVLQNTVDNEYDKSTDF